MARVLVVDDEISIVEMYELLLKLHGHTVVGKAINGQEAVEMYSSITPKPDLVIMDHRMPIKNGLEASREIINYDKAAKIIFASADGSIMEEAKRIGIVSFKIKPFDNDRLLKNIEKVMEMN